MTFATFQAEFCVPDYISRQVEVTKTMRAILVDWLVEVQESFELNHETLYTAVKILDLYMSKVVVDKRDLQLVGATACLIACKIDERIPPCLDDFVYVCDDAYTRSQIKAKEREVLECVGFDVGYPLSYRFVRRYGRVSFCFQVYNDPKTFVRRSLFQVPSKLFLGLQSQHVSVDVRSLRPGNFPAGIQIQRGNERIQVGSRGSGFGIEGQSSKRQVGQHFGLLLGIHSGGS